MATQENNLNPNCANPGLGEGWESFSCEPFRPRRGARSGHLQTLVSCMLPRSSCLPAPEQRLFQVEAGCQVLCICHWQPNRRDATTAVLVHGLEGSSDSHYMIGTAGKAWAAGMNVVRMNVRNCGGTEKLAPTLYHSGLSGDVGAVVRELVERDALPRLCLAGFSMGGNQVLKLAGEWGAEAPRQVRAVAAVSPAVDLGSSADALHAWANRPYEWRFLLSLRQRLRLKNRLFPHRFAGERWWWRSLREFDETVTAPNWGFEGAQDYYQRAAAARVVDRIAVPTLVLHAQDDPFIRLTPETRAKMAANRKIKLVETEHGGHCGFLAGQCYYDGRWAERQVIRFFEHA